MMLSMAFVFTKSFFVWMPIRGLSDFGGTRGFCGLNSSIVSQTGFPEEMRKKKMGQKQWFNLFMQGTP